MSSILHIDGIEYHPAPAAAKQLGYTKEYLLMLAKQEKIDGRKIENRWYVNIPSVEAFFASAHDKRKDTNSQIRTERKLELEVHEKDRDAHALRLHRIEHRSKALVETLAVLVIGLAMGATSYTGIQVGQQASVASASAFVNAVALSLYRIIVPLPQVYTVASNGDASTHTPAPSDAPWTGALVQSPIQAVQDSFSDKVQVSLNPTNQSIAVVTPVFKDGEGAPQRFVLTPIAVGTSTELHGTLNQ